MAQWYHSSFIRRCGSGLRATILLRRAEGQDGYLSGTLRPLKHEKEWVERAGYIGKVMGENFYWNRELTVCVQ